MKRYDHITNREVKFPQDANILSTTNLKGQITYCNDQFVDISGFTSEELQGKSHNIVRHPDMPREAFASLWERLKSGNSWMGIVKNRCKNGDHYWVDAYVTPIMNGDKPIEYQSVRNRPAREYVERANKLYGQINAGRLPAWIRFKYLPYSLRLGLAFFLTTLSIVSVPIMNGNINVETLLSGMAVSLVIGGGFAYWVSRPMAVLVDKAHNIIKDPITSYIYSGRYDEAGEVLLALRYAESETRGVVGRIADSADGIMNAAEELSSAIHLNVKGINQHHIETDRVAEAVTQMAATVQEVANSTNHSAAAAVQAEKEAKSSKETVANSMQAIQGLTSEVEIANSVIQKLDADSENIASVINVITSISEQTNLLALNAAIEAARAGIHGRGFSVVAEEVRTLASRTYEATQEIQSIIENLQRVAAEAVEAIKRTHAMADDTLAQAKKTVSLLDAISEAVSSISDMNAQIATAMTQQNIVTQELDRNVVNIRDVSELSLDASAYADQSVQSMEELASQLNRLSEQFWLKRT
ncbi:MAG: PAS domain-containing methyl-accepting chemotaxis protein [Sedimenticola sp.]